MNSKKYIALLMLALCIFGCSLNTEYKKIVKRELATGIRNDTILLDFYFGMPEPIFYSTCWDYNQQGIIKEGFSNVTVYYPLEGLKHEGFFDFFPIFKTGKIQSIQGFTMYKGWAPWNKELWSDKLIEDTRELYEQSYEGNKFFPIKSLGIGKAYTKIDGNRRIVLYYTEDNRVNVLFSDLTNEDDVLILNED
ncbi:MAG: hypothetical protein OEQ53_02400 [Saprospiraceae bacterium]|nr:hypothetical protein [Saprospiraceae bacterium]